MDDRRGEHPGDATLALLREGELEVAGRLVAASNATLYCSVTAPPAPPATPPRRATCVYKPTRGERPLDDFPDGTLAAREVAAYVVSEATGWDIVPPTVLRDGPYGAGMVQLWIEPDDSADPVALIQRGDPAIRRIALFDAVVNNADRKVGHLLPVAGGHVYGVDHGICFAVAPKLRTVLWGWRGTPLTADELGVLERLRADLDGGLDRALAPLLARAEVAATARRVDRLLASGVFPQPDPRRPAIPWPPY